MRRLIPKPLALVSAALALVFAACRADAPEAAKPPAPPPAKASAAPADYEALMTRATALVSNNRPERAIAPYNTALALRPDDPEAHYGRGLARLMLKDEAGAIEDLDKAIDAQPAYADAYFVRAEANRLRGKDEEAKPDYARYLELDPEGLYAERARAHLEDAAQAPAGSEKN